MTKTTRARTASSRTAHPISRQRRSAAGRRRPQTGQEVRTKPGKATRRPRRTPISTSLPAPFLLLAAVVVGLSLLGLTMVLSASSVTSLARTGSPWGEFTSQLAWLGLGFGAMTATTLISHHVLRRFTLPLLAVSVLLLIGVLVPSLGVSVNGAQRWIRLGPLQFQPSEIAKFTLALYAADVLARRTEITFKQTVRPICVILGFFGGLILLQPNLGTTIIIFAIGLSVLFASGVRLGVIVALGSVSVIGATLLAYFWEYRRARLLTFLDPWADPLDGGWQTIQSLVSVANGGVTGVGIGASRGKYGFLPEAHNDFVFAVTAEEFGLVGAVVVVLLFVTFGLVSLSVARKADRFGALLVVGITTWILVQAFVNMGAVLGLMPITGVPLPFMSAGGTSLVATLAAVGVVLNVARSTGK